MYCVFSLSVNNFIAQEAVNRVVNSIILKLLQIIMKSYIYEKFVLLKGI